MEVKGSTTEDLLDVLKIAGSRSNGQLTDWLAKQNAKQALNRDGHTYWLDPEMLMAIVVTLLVATSALYIILSDHYGQDSLKWAYGAIGTVVGYWLKR